jgi:hypothetical protein
MDTRTALQLCNVFWSLSRKFKQLPQLGDLEGCWIWQDSGHVGPDQKRPRNRPGDHGDH